MGNPKSRFDFRWKLTQEAGEDQEAEILLYSEIVSWKWSPDDTSEMTAQEFDKLLKAVKEKGAQRLRLRINSPGGEVAQAVAMKTMLELSGLDLVIDIEGLCASAATFFTTIQGAKVRIASGSEFMIHNPRCGCRGTAKDFEQQAKRLYQMEEEQHGWYAAKTGKSEEEIKALMDATTWYTASEAVKQGFCDELLQVQQAAACLDTDSLELMDALYRDVPEELRKQKINQVSTGEPAEHKENGHKEETQMDLTNMTPEELKQAAPELYQKILNSGVTAERQRIQQIDDLTAEGYEELAQKAKQEGTSAQAFMTELVKAQREKKKSFLDSRRKETAPSEQVTGGASEDQDGAKEEEELEQFAKESKRLAEELKGSSFGMF